ncbi:MAG: FAD-binding oxidoreductase [Pseudomonadota bacterium]
MSFPHYDNTCGWNQLLPPRVPHAPLSADTSVDVAVIGAGYTGLAAGKRWAESRPDERVAVIDATTLGEGSPGRNSGFLLEITLANDADVQAVTRLQTCNGLLGTTIRRLRDTIYDAGIDCQIEHCGVYRAAAGAAGRAALTQYAAFLSAADLPFERLSRDALGERLGTRFYAEGLFSPHCYLVQPAALIRGLASTLPGNLTLYENTPASRLVREAGGWRVITPEGELSAGRVVVANNAFAKELGIARSRLTAIYTYAALTEPLSADTGSEGTWGLLPAHRLGATLRRTRDNRLLVRAHYDYERETPNVRVAKELAACLGRRFPGLGQARFESVWGGATGLTLNGAPVWGEYKPGLFVSAGCNGGGVVKGTLFGECLADLALGQPCPDISSLFGQASWMPPDPLRRLGFSLTAWLERRQAAAEM